MPGDICVFGKSIFNTAAMNLPSSWYFQAQGCVTMVVYWYVNSETCTGISQSPNS